MNSVIVLPSAKRRAEFYNNDTRWCCYSQCSVAMWPTMVIHGNSFYNKNDTTKAALQEAFEHLKIEGFYVGTLSRGSVHHNELDPPNGLVEYTGGMAYVVWSWEVIIKWLTYGWPRPLAQDLNAPVGTWMWNDKGRYVEPEKEQAAYEQLFPLFEYGEALQLKRAGIPRSVIQGERHLTESEAVDVAARALGKQRAYRKRSRFHYKQHRNKTKHHEAS